MAAAKDPKALAPSVVEAEAVAPATPPAASIPTQVFLRVGGTDEAPELRPAVVVRAHTLETVNMMVFMDGANDASIELPSENGRGHPGIRWCTSVSRGDGFDQWRSAV